VLNSQTDKRMSTAEKLAANYYVSNRSTSLIQSRHLSTSTREDSSFGSDGSAPNVYVSFAKDEKKNLTPYEKLLYDSEYDPRIRAEENAERRIGFYRLYKDIGLGNFSRVKLGVHILARGKSMIFFD
jgi:hypothetical protein